MTKPNTKRIAVREKGDKQEYRDDKGNWIPCNESKLQELYMIWVVSDNINRYYDDNGYLVFDYKEQMK